MGERRGGGHRGSGRRSLTGVLGLSALAPSVLALAVFLAAAPATAQRTIGVQPSPGAGRGSSSS